MHSFAQTSPQFFNQLRNNPSVESHHVKMLHRGYKLAMLLFSGMYRPSGKPFVAHVVGTASILLKAGASIDVVAAGLLHSAYDNGDFGHARKSATARSRAMVGKEVGPDVEHYIFKYANFEWSHRRFDEIIQSIPHMRDEDREVVRMRLADKLEDHLDSALLYCQSAPVQPGFQDRRDKMIRMAELIDDPFLAGELRRNSQEILSNPDSGLRFAPTDRSFLLSPLSYRIRGHVGVARFALSAPRRVRGRARRLLVRNESRTKNSPA